MLIGGLWHGASLTFIVWGGINGVALIIHKFFVKIRKKQEFSTPFASIIKKTLSALACFGFVTFTWVFFRAESFSNTAEMFIGLTRSEGITQIYSWTFVAIFFAIAEIIWAILKRNKNNGKISSEYIILDLTKISGLILFFTFVGITVMLAYIGNTAFIYGNF